MVVLGLSVAGEAQAAESDTFSHDSIVSDLPKKTIYHWVDADVGSYAILGGGGISSSPFGVNISTSLRLGEGGVGKHLYLDGPISASLYYAFGSARTLGAFYTGLTYLTRPDSKITPFIRYNLGVSVQALTSDKTGLDRMYGGAGFESRLGAGVSILRSPYARWIVSTRLLMPHYQFVEEDTEEPLDKKPLGVMITFGGGMPGNGDILDNFKKDMRYAR